MFEKEDGEAMKMTKAILSECLELQKDSINLDLVFVAACQSEFVGEIFVQKGARHVICVDRKKSVLDDVAIDFTLNLYHKILLGEDISKAYHLAVNHSKVMFESDEVELFKLKVPTQKPDRNAILLPEDGEPIYLSD